MGIMYVRAFPTLSRRVLGDVRQRDDKGSRQRELLLHLANIKPPASFNLGNASYSSSRNPCADTSTSDITTFFSPSPASNRRSFSRSVVGIVVWLRSLRQTNWWVQLETRGCFLDCVIGNALLFLPWKKARLNSLPTSFLACWTPFSAVRPALTLRRVSKAESHLSRISLPAIKF